MRLILVIVTSLFGFILISGFKEDNHSLLVIDNSNVFVQDTTKKDSLIIFPNPIFEPEFPGGTIALIEFINQNIDRENIPTNYQEDGVVYVQFSILKNGGISDIRVSKGVNKWLDDEAVRIVKLMPNWTPAYMDDNYVNLPYTIPFNFHFLVDSTKF